MNPGGGHGSGADIRNEDAPSNISRSDPPIQKRALAIVLLS